ncbi:MAG: gamma-glutamyl-gamma-aminobutyrate hydrolase family protein [Pseudolysinimonas sp.]
MNDARFRIAIPARLGEARADRNVQEAQELLQLVVELAESVGFDVTVVNGGDTLDKFDGFVVPGGGDVDPALYGETAGPGEVYDVNPAQDALDLHVLEFAAVNDKPLLAICRGAQLLNVQRGGTLHVDLDPSSVVHLPAAITPTGDDIRDIFVWHDVAFAADSALATASGSTRLRVASGHHQGIRKVGQGLTVIATSEDGLVEAIASDRPGEWLLGVQWHPEIADGDPRGEQAPFVLLREALAANRPQ